MDLYVIIGGLVAAIGGMVASFLVGRKQERTKRKLDAAKNKITALEIEDEVNDMDSITLSKQLSKWVRDK